MKIFLSCCFFCSVLLLSAQPTTPQFPQAWTGIWTGNLEIFNTYGEDIKVKMELHIQPIANSENYTWTIIYGEDKEAGKRAYELKPVDVAIGHYVIDEKNSILIDAYLVGNKLFERFSVMGSMLIATTELQGDELIYEIISGKDEAASTTGNTKQGDEEIPTVQSFPIAVRQVATLKRKE